MSNTNAPIGIFNMVKDKVHVNKQGLIPHLSVLTFDSFRIAYLQLNQFKITVVGSAPYYTITLHNATAWLTIDKWFSSGFI